MQFRRVISIELTNFDIFIGECEYQSILTNHMQSK